MPKITRRQCLRISLQSLLLLMTMPVLKACRDEGDIEKDKDSHSSNTSTEVEEQSGEDTAVDSTTSNTEEEGEDSQSDTEEETVEDSGEETTGDSGEEEEITLSWDEFIIALAGLASLQHSSTWNPEEHVDAAGELMQRLDPQAQPILDALSAYADNAIDFPEITTIHEEIEFEVVVIQFEEGEEIDLHNHPDMTGVILCLDGNVNIEAFNLLNETSSQGNMLIQQVEDVQLQNGDLATLTPERGNIHYLKANSFTQLLDIFTPPYAGDRITQYRWYSRSSTPYDGRPDVFEAWEL